MTRTIIQESEKALVWRVNIQFSFSFEVAFKMMGNYAKNKGQIVNPKDEDFGVWAWSFYTEEGAMKRFEEINSGVQKITPMVEEV